MKVSRRNGKGYFKFYKPFFFIVPFSFYFLLFFRYPRTLITVSWIWECITLRAKRISAVLSTCYVIKDMCVN